MRTLPVIVLLLCQAFILRSQVWVDSDTLNRTDDKSLKQGYWIKKSEEGLLMYEGRFINDQPTGRFIYYYPDESRKAVSFFYNGGKCTRTTLFHHNGTKMSEGNYINQKKDSLWKFYNTDGVLLAEEFYSLGKKNGVAKTYHDSSGVAEEITYANDTREGPWRQYYADGRLKLEGGHTGGEKQGDYREYFPSGQLRLSGAYHKSMRMGEWIYYTEEGKVMKKELYNPDGSLKAETWLEKKPEEGNRDDLDK